MTGSSDGGVLHCDRVGSKLRQVASRKTVEFYTIPAKPLNPGQMSNQVQSRVDPDQCQSD
jgi:hypothetical protein